ncbi:hypothetical protein DSECCO2_442860 [anaerobic digester metagenome]
MKFVSGMSFAYKILFVFALFVAASQLNSPVAFADKVFVENDVVIIGKNFVISTPYDDGVVLESKKGAFAPTKFFGAEGTAAMLFLYNRITRDMGVDLVMQTYKGRIDRREAEEKVDAVLRFYLENELIFKSRFVEKPATKIGICRFRV